MAFAPPGAGAAFTQAEATRMAADPIRSQLVQDCQTMVRHALSLGLELPPAVMDGLALVGAPPVPGDLAPLAGLHAMLSRIVAPATPFGLRMVQEDAANHPGLHVLGPLPSLRCLMVAAIMFSVMFISLAVFPEINHESLRKDIYDMSGLTLLIPLLFLLSAAGLGATFGALFEAYQLVSEGRFDSKFDSIYWTRIGLGLISGLMMAEMLPRDGGNGTSLEPALIALLGGFSAAVVHRILQRFVSVIESVFTPVPGALSPAPAAYLSRAADPPRLEHQLAAAAMTPLAGVPLAAPAGNAVLAQDGNVASKVLRFPPRLPAAAAGDGDGAPQPLDGVAEEPVPSPPDAMPTDRLLAALGQGLTELPFKRWVARTLHTPLNAAAVPAEAVTPAVVDAVFQRRPRLPDALAATRQGAEAAGLALLRDIAAGNGPAVRDRLAAYGPAGSLDPVAADIRSVLLDVVVTSDLAPLLPAPQDASAVLAATDARQADPSGAARLDALMLAIVQGRDAGWTADQVLRQAAATQAAAGLEAAAWPQ